MSQSRPPRECGCENPSHCVACLRDEVDEWRASADVMRAENAALKKLLSKVSCSFCGAQFSRDDADCIAKVAEHMAVCEKHPLAEARGQLAAAGLIIAWQAGEITEMQACRLLGTEPVQLRESCRFLIGSVLSLLAEQRAASNSPPASTPEGA